MDRDSSFFEFVEELVFAAAIVGAGVIFFKFRNVTCLAVLIVLNIVLLLRCTDTKGSWIQALHKPCKKLFANLRGALCCMLEILSGVKRRFGGKLFWPFAKVFAIIVLAMCFVYAVAGWRTMAGVLLCMAFILLVMRVAKARDVGNISNVIGIVGFCVSFSALWPWIYEQYTSAKEAEEFYKTSVMMDQQEYDPETALYYAEKAQRKLPVLNAFFPKIPKAEDISHQVAYLKGMVSVKELLNLDRPLKQSEKTRAMRALGEANILEEIEKNGKTYYRPCTLKAQIYTALGQYDEAQKWIDKSIPGVDRGFSCIRAATLNICIAKNRHERREEALSNASNYLERAETALARKYSKRCDFRERLAKVANVTTNLMDEATLRKNMEKVWQGCDGDEWLKARSEARWLYFWKGIWHLECDGRKWDGERAVAAISNLNRALLCDSNFYLAKYNMGLCAQKSRDRELAKKWILSAIDNSPEFSKALATIGWLYGLDDKYAVAEGYLRKAVKIDGDSVDCRLKLGMVLYEMEKYKEAIDEYTHAITLNPDNSELYARKALCEIEIPEGYRTAEHSLYIAKDVWERQSDIRCGTNEFYAISGEVSKRFSMSVVGDREVRAAYHIICMACGTVAMKAHDFARAQRYYEAAESQMPGLRDATLKRLDAMLHRAGEPGMENVHEKVKLALAEIMSDKEIMSTMTDDMRIRMGDLYDKVGDFFNAGFMYDSVSDGRWLKSKAKERKAIMERRLSQSAPEAS